MPRPSRIALALGLMLMATGLRVTTQTTAGWAETPAPVTLYPIGDATVADEKRHSNFGSEPTLVVDDKPRSEAYVRFSVPAGVSGRAVLRLWVLDPTKNGPKVKRYNGSLDESTITWGTRVSPLVGTGVTIGALQKDTWAEWDVTDLVAGATDVTLALAAESSDGADFGSRESDRRPELVFSAGPDTPTTTTTRPTTTTSTSTSTTTSSTTTSSTTTTTKPPVTTTTTVPGSAPECRPDWKKTEKMGRLPSGFAEFSGFVASPVHRDWAWGIRDSGNPTSLYAIRPGASGGPELREFAATGGRSNWDWEDLAYTPGFAPGTGHLWVLENVGNSWTGNRWIYQFEEPDPNTPVPPPPAPLPVATLVGAYQWAYPDMQFNTETMFVFDGDLVVVTKSEPSRVYRFNGPLRPFIVNVPSFVGTLPAGKLLSIAALSVDQRTLAVSNHGKLDVYENRGDADDLAALISNHVLHVNMPSDNREGGSFFPYGSCDIVLVAESKNLWRLEHD